MTVLSILLATALVAGPQPDFSSIRSDFHQGKLSAVEYAELLVTASSQPDKLDTRYLTDRERPEKCLTPYFHEAVSVLNENGYIPKDVLDPRYRPQMQHSYVSPEGYFTIHYDTSGNNAVYQSGTDVNPADGVPDYVNRCGEIMDYVWHTEIDSLGYDPPGADFGLGGSDNYDIYLVKINAYGVTYPEGQAAEYPDRNAVYSHIHLHPTYSGFGYSDRLLPLKVTGAHEFKHAIQFSYNAAYNPAQAAWMEHCAVWMEDIAYDSINDYLTYLPYFFNAPHINLYDMYSQDGFFPYGACVWAHYLDHMYGRDFIRQIWIHNITTGAQQAVDLALQTVGSSRAEAAADFRIWNYYTGIRDDGNHYEEGETWPLARIMVEHTLFPVTDGAPFSGQSPQGLACNYIRFSDINELDDIRLYFERADEWSEWEISYINITDSGHEISSMEITDEPGTIVLPTGNSSSIVMIPTTTVTYNGNYTYWARDAGQLLVFDDFYSTDQGGDGDGRIEEGETFTVGASFTSLAADWETTQMIVRSLDPAVTVTDSIIIGGSIHPLEELVFPEGTIELNLEDLEESHVGLLELAVGPAGEPSQAWFFAEIRLGIPPVLVMDDDNGMEHQDYIKSTLDSLGVYYDHYDNALTSFPDYPDAALETAAYNAVLWITGDSGNGLDEGDQTLLSGMLESGVNVLVSGQDIAELLSETTEGTQFLNDQLGVDYDGTEPSHGLMGPEGDPLFGDLRFGTAGVGMDGANNQISQDKLLVMGDVEVCLNYGSGSIAAVRREFDDTRLMFCGFGIEAVVDDNNNLNSRKEFLDITLNYLRYGIVGTPENPIPADLSIQVVWPNPAKNLVNVRLSQPVGAEDIVIRFHDLSGRLVETISSGTMDIHGNVLAFPLPSGISSGIYMIRLQTGKTASTIPVTILR